MKKIQWKIIKRNIIAILIFFGLSIVYFSPILEGKKIYQSDKVNFIGMSKEIKDHRSDYDEEPLWTNSMFGGMPAYQISVVYSANLVKHIDKIFQGFLPRPAGLVFLYLLGFYILLMSLKIDYRLALVGAIAFAFSSYFFIILEAGHNTKAHAIGYMSPLLASVLMTMRGKWFTGGVLTALFTSLILNANHLQITYYLIMLFLVLGTAKLIEAIKENQFKYYLKSVLVLLLAGVLGASTNITRVLTTYEYGEESMRGKSDLTKDLDNKTSGLDKDYATAWSYGKAESFTLLIPNFYGGSSQGELGTDSETYNAIKQSPQSRKIIKQLPLYWGEQPFTSGPVYAGAIVCFLFVMGLFMLKGYMRWWVIITTILMLALGWGKNFMPLTEFFLEHFPGYNKFRAVSTTLVIVEFLLPLFGFIALNKLLFDNNKNESYKSIKWSLIITGGLCLIFALLPSIFFDFTGSSDEQLKNMGWPIDALQSDRRSLMISDAWRSFIFISLSALLLYLYLKNTLKKQYVILIIGLLIIGDMWTVNKRYLDNDDFKSKRKVAEPFSPSVADQQILADKDPNFRVFNSAVNTFNDASTSYYHKSIGGYHGAKLKRYQELIDAHISKGNMSVLNMLNTKYFIVANQNQKIAQRNTGALGNAWFVKEVQLVTSADEELAALSNINTQNKAVINTRYSDMISQFDMDSLASIILTDYKANHLTYTANCSQEQLAIFSEIFYDKGWNAYLNGNLVPHFRANYLLRAMMIPSGSHKIEFKFEPSSFDTGENISFASSAILLILLLGVFYNELKI